MVANINGDDRGKIHFQNSGANIDGDVEAVSLIFEDSHSLSQAVSGTIGGLDIFEIKKGTMVYDKEINGGASSVVVGEGATLDIGTNALHSGGDKGVDGEGVHFKDNSTLAFTVTDKDTYGKIYANYINISKNGTNLNMTLNGAALAKGETTTLKLFNGEDSDEVEIEGKFANLSKNSRYEFADNGDGTFKVTSVASAADTVADAGGSANNAGTAEAWDSVSASISSPVAASVTEKLAQLSNSTDAAEQKAYVDALTAVAPEVAPMVQKTQTETANQVFGTVGTRLTGGSISTGGEGMASGDSISVLGSYLPISISYLPRRKPSPDILCNNRAFGLCRHKNGVYLSYNFEEKEMKKVLIIAAIAVIAACHLMHEDTHDSHYFHTGHFDDSGQRR